MKWTIDPPDKEGWYWFRSYISFVKSVLYVSKSGPLNKYVATLGNLSGRMIYKPVNELKGEWSGPLIPPTRND